MKTVGQLLKEQRLKKKLDLTTIGKETKINIKYLEAIEIDNYQLLPPATFSKGFIQNYAKFVGLDEKNILAVFRRDYDQDETGHIIPRSLSESTNSKFFFNPTTTTIISSVVIGVLVLLFLIWQLKIFNSAPNLTVDQPKESESLESPITVTGQTTPLSTITVNNQSVTVKEDGSFLSEYYFPPGEHTIIIVSKGRGGKETKVERHFNITK